ncbi:hypothetical protein N7465_004094 [Penicillium sp. CMV-2018d]|nr:hypothetical protein N7465_004094 [Penicillium sp. CMV-2018d]
MKYGMCGDKTDEELDLECSGDICLLQRYRYATLLNRVYRSPCPADLKELLQVEVELRENTQREIALKEEIEELTEAKEGTDVAVIQGLQEKLWKLSTEYWILERYWWTISQNGICIESLWKIALGEEVVVAETVDAVLIASQNQNGNLQLVIVPWSVLVAGEPGGLHSTLS